MKTLINWFEIPAADFERAVRFYEAVFAVELRRDNWNSGPFAVFPYTEPATGGAVCHMETLLPGPCGTVVYLDGGDDLAVPLSRVAGAGGKVVMPKTLLPHDIGYIALFEDSEGNRVGLHSPR